MMQTPAFDPRHAPHHAGTVEAQSAFALLDKAYANDWTRFLSWCDHKRKASVAADPEMVAEFLEAESALGFSAITIRHRLSAIGHMHRRYRALPPLLHKNGEIIHLALARMGTTRGRQPPLRATTTILRSILSSIEGESLKAARDRSLLALRIAGAFQISELTTLTWAKIRRSEGKLEIDLGNWGSRTPDHRNVLTIIDDAVLQPVALLENWLGRSGIIGGRIFLQVTEHDVTGAAMTKSEIAAAIQARAFAAGFGDAVLNRITARKSSASTTGQDHQTDNRDGNPGVLSDKGLRPISAENHTA